MRELKIFLGDNITSSADTQGNIYLIASGAPPGPTPTPPPTPVPTPPPTPIPPPSGSVGPIPGGDVGPIDFQTLVAYPNGSQSRTPTHNFSQGAVVIAFDVPLVFIPYLNNSHWGFLNLLPITGQYMAAREIEIRNSTGAVLAAGAGSTQPGVNYQANNPGAHVNFMPGERIYYICRNRYQGQSTCPIGQTANFSLDHAAPNSY